MILRQHRLVAQCVAVALVAIAIAGCKSKKYAPVEFRGETYRHVKVVSVNKLVVNHFYTASGKSVPESPTWLQITTLDAAVTAAQRDTLDRQIKSTMRVRPLAGTSDRLFGVLQSKAIYVLMLDDSYLLYVRPTDGQSAAELRDGATEVIDALQDVDYLL